MTGCNSFTGSFSVDGNKISLLRNWQQQENNVLTGWVTIAEMVVNFKVEKDVVIPRFEEKKVDKIRLKCTQGTLKLKNVWVEMSDGTRKEYDAKGIGVLNKGMTSFVWDLPGKGGEAILERVELEYDAIDHRP